MPASNGKATNAAVHTLVSAVATLPPVLLGAAALARRLPMDADARFALAFTLLVPAWVAAMCTALLARTSWRALLYCSVASVLIWALLST
jgi:hypothetical protein